MAHEDPPHIGGPDDSLERQAFERSRELPVLLLFGAEWSAPCRVMGTALDRLVRNCGGKFLLMNVDIEALPGLTARFDIRSVPSAVALKDGRVVDGFSGVLSPSDLGSFLDRVLARRPDAPVRELTMPEETAAGSFGALLSAAVVVFTAYRDEREIGIDLNRQDLARRFRIKAGSVRAHISAHEGVVGLVEGQVLEWPGEPGSVEERSCTGSARGVGYNSGETGPLRYRTRAFGTQTALAPTSG